MRFWIAFITAAAILSGGCGNPASKDKVSYVSAGDARMNTAMAGARSSVGTFVTALQSPKTGQEAFAIKMPFSDGSNTEHMWLSPVSYDGKNFQGVVNNEPEKVKTVKSGQKVTVAPSEISDWMYVDNGNLVGGFTMRVLRDTMTPAERAEFDKSVPFKVK